MAFCSDGPLPPPRNCLRRLWRCLACVIKCNKTDEVTIKRVAQGKSNHALPSWLVDHYSAI